MKTHVHLRELREARGLAAAELAARTGVTRQTIYAVEEGSFVPNTAVALRLARALDATVEQIFSIEEDGATVVTKADLLSVGAMGETEETLVRLCQVHGRAVAVAASSASAYLPVADGRIESQSAGRVLVATGTPPRNSEKRLLLAGCDPALSILADLLRAAGIEMIGVPCASRRALEWLKQGRVHAAGSHLLDQATGEYNVPIIRRSFPKRAVRVVAFASWEQGFVAPRGNPKEIRSFADLARRTVKIVNRESGSGSRDLLDHGLRRAGVAARSVRGYREVAGGHLAAARAVAIGVADCCIASRSAARCFGLDFVPLAVERFDLCFSKASLELPAAQAALDLLNRAILRNKLRAIAEYDTGRTGEVLL